MTARKHRRQIQASTVSGAHCDHEGMNLLDVLQCPRCNPSCYTHTNARHRVGSNYNERGTA